MMDLKEKIMSIVCVANLKWKRVSSKKLPFITGQSIFSVAEQTGHPYRWNAIQKGIALTRFPKPGDLSMVLVRGTLAILNWSDVWMPESPLPIPIFGFPVGLYELAKEMTDRLQKENRDVFWDGRLPLAIEKFCEKNKI
jgi:hypothetical protein